MKNYRNVSFKAGMILITRPILFLSLKIVKSWMFSRKLLGALYLKAEKVILHYLVSLVGCIQNSRGMYIKY